MPETTQKNRVTDDYVVKPINIEEIDRVIEIWSFAFGFSDPVRWRKFFESCLDERLGIYLDDYLVGVVGIAHFEMWLGDKLVPCGGISAVATDPAHRRRGIVRKCLKTALQSLHDKRIPVSTLWPFSYPFYARMGYEVADFRYEVQANCHVLPDIGDSSKYKRIDNKDFESLKSIHEEWIKRSNLSHRRSQSQWVRHVHNPRRETSIYKSDDAYFIWNTDCKIPRTLEIVEWAYLSEESFYDGLSLLRRVDDLSYDKILWITPEPEELTSFGITDPIIEFKMKPGIMARVVHTDAFIDCLDLEVDPFIIDDPLAISGSYNGGSNGKSDVETVSPGRLIQLVSGVLSKQGSGKDLNLTNHCAAKKPFCIEFF